MYTNDNISKNGGQVTPMMGAHHIHTSDLDNEWFRIKQNSTPVPSHHMAVINVGKFNSQDTDEQEISQ